MHGDSVQPVKLYITIQLQERPQAVRDREFIIWSRSLGSDNSLVDASYFYS